ncbi:MAG: RdgB/HAM1 family non-canonical purine NTP pyrophosphatase [Armatimonadota bacterium]
MTQSLLVATTNKGKIAELTRLLAEYPVQVVGLDAYPEAPELPEPHDTFAANAQSKALAAAQYASCLALADDSGLEVEALGGRPGVLSARYAASDPERIARLLAEMKGLTGEQRQARFVCAIALAQPGKLLGLWQETCEGLISEAPSGDHGFGFDPVFVHGNRSFAELSSEEKNALSHRGKAMRAFLSDFAQLLSSFDTE